MNLYDTLEELKNTKSRNEKIRILEDADNLTKSVFHYTYNPFMHYFINKKPAYTDNKLVNFSLRDMEWMSLLNKLASRVLSGNTALHEVSEFMRALTPKDADIFFNILKKDLRCGTGVKTINAAIPGLVPIFEVMRAKKWEDDMFHDNLCMSFKYDGLRAVYMDGALYTRNGIKIKGAEELLASLSSVKSEIALDGELLIPDMHFQESSGHIRNFSKLPTSTVFHVFDIFDGKDPFIKRYEIYKQLCIELASPYIKPIKHVKIKSLERLYEVFEQALSLGYEGLVIKTLNHEYQMKRSKDWLKLKDENDEDIPVVDFFEGTGKYEGMLGGIIVKRKNGILIRVGSGFSDTQREEIWQNKESYRNLITEIKYHEETPDRSLRHPVFKSFRYDKS